VSAHRWAPWAAAALISLLALPPRLAGTDRFVTTDELFWIGRSANFARALGNGQFGQTFQTGHPGVATMWTALLGIGPGRAGELAGGRREVSRREVSQSGAFLPSLAAARKALGIATALGIGVSALLAWRLFGPAAAILGGCLLALDPFLLAHSRLVHIDASLSIWMIVAALAAISHWSVGGRGTLALGSVSTALALLCKAPAALLGGFVPLAAVGLGGLGAWRGGRAWRDLLLWATVAMATYVALWPAMWVAPAETLGQVVGFARENANPAHAAGAAEGGPGLLFYPLVFVLRSTPLSLLGLVLLVLLRPSGQPARGVALLASYGIGFGLIITFAAKNFDRYLLPVFPAVDLLAGLGYWRLVERIAPPARRASLLLALLTAVIGLSGWWILASWPYELTYANPMAGGPTAANARIASGWGEGLDQVAAYLNRQPNAGRLKVGMPGEIYTTVLGAQFRGQVGPAEGADAAAYDYLVVYLRNAQLAERPPFFDDRYLAWPPEATVLLGGVDYAWIYNTALGAPVGAQFGDLLTLEGYGLDGATVRPGRRLELRLRWRALRDVPPGLRLAVELRPAQTGRGPVAGIFALQTGDSAGWRPGAIAGESYSLVVDASAEPGPYVVVARVLDAAGRPLQLTRLLAPGPEALAEPDAVALRGLQLR